MSDDVSIRDALLRRHLYSFVQKTFNTLHPGQAFIPAWHVDAICNKLEQVANGKIRRLLITVPPRHLKSICTSVAFIAWILGKDPRLRVLVASYGHELSAKHSRDFRKIIMSPWYQDIFPQFGIDPKRNTELEIMTTLRGGRRSVSTGGATTGFGCDLLVVDDVMKAADAQSDVERARVQEYYEQTLFSRLDDKENGRIIVIQQRLHEDDFAGYLLDKRNFVHLNLPAIAEEDEVVALSHGRRFVRQKGEPLFPERESLETLEKIRLEIGTFAFSSQYQQDPVPPEGNRLRWEWFGSYDEQPPRTALQMVVQSWDTAMTAEPTSDFSVCTVWGYLNGDWLLLDVLRERLEYPALKHRVIHMADHWIADKVLIEYAGTGISLFRELNKEYGSSYFGMRPTRDKEVRFATQGAKLETGKFLLPKSAPWLAIFKREMLGFPNTKFDDQADSVSQFLDWTGSRRGEGWQHIKLTGKRRRRPGRRSRESMRA